MVIPHSAPILECFSGLLQRNVTMTAYDFLMGDGRGDHCMRPVTEYRQRARDCRDLARIVHKLEDKYALDCAAQSWERLADRSERDIDAED